MHDYTLVLPTCPFIAMPWACNTFLCTLGGAKRVRAATRVLIGGLLAMGITFGAGAPLYRSFMRASPLCWLVVATCGQC